MKFRIMSIMKIEFIVLSRICISLVYRFGKATKRGVRMQVIINKAEIKRSKDTFNLLSG